ncbi:hypothetical protein [Tenacibaculum soleae]|nr:hypothetical protein [Tenacibaculum soleae]MDO6743527.1 hypothetical protein [Tenacibaculum soleae]MDO6811932.1 hypothetical protein [Tenacibaculum soleae]
MKKSILNFGKALNKIELKQINGGRACSIEEIRNGCRPGPRGYGCYC